MPQASLYSCNVCSLQFASAELTLRHHLETHAVHKCQLCEAKAKDGQMFCEACVDLIPETTKHQNSAREIDALANKLSRMRAQQSRNFDVLKRRFFAHRAEFYCDHNIAKTMDCEKCADRAARHVPAPSKYVELSDEDLKGF